MTGKRIKAGNPFHQIINHRLINQCIMESPYQDADQLVSYMGAMQAQDYAMVKWAIGCRLPDSTENDIVEAFSKGKIIRTHLLRPTWHVVAAEDIYWILQLTAPYIKSGMKSRDRELELTETVLKKSNNLLINALRDHQYLTREEIAKMMTDAKIALDNNRLSHLLMNAELDGLICNGPDKGKKLTYALLEVRVPVKKKLTKEESLHKLAYKYFISHGPATLQDFTWWSGLPVREARTALELVKHELTSQVMGDDTYWFGNLNEKQNYSDLVRLLPAFDEYLISYRKRDAVLSQVPDKKVVSNNGIFRPIVVVNGQVVGIWKRTVKNTKVEIEAELMSQTDKQTLKQIELMAEKYGNFIGKKPFFKFTENK